MAGCGPGSEPAEGGAPAAARAPAGSGAIFVERARESGLDFRHDHGGRGDYYFPEIMGGGCGLVDVDRDGDLDAYVVQSGPLDPAPAPGARDRLFRNDPVLAADGSREPRFTDVTERAGLVSESVGMGLAAGDYDNDGFIDLYVTSFGPARLLRNRGDGSFEDVTAAAGAADDRWSTSAAFFDYDGDGWLDLFVAHYVDFRVTRNIRCAGPSGRRDYCSPTTYDGLPARLLRNRAGRFEDVSGASGILAEYSSGLGVVTADLDGDGWTDVYVANDQRPNHLWRNRGDGSFENVALLAGTAVDLEGRAQAGMGVDAGDFDGDGDDDLFVTNLGGETNTIYVNRGGGLFDDLTESSGLGPPSLPFTGFGTSFFDYDNDGWLDLFVANGAVYAIEALARAGDPYPYSETNLLFRNTGDGSFADVTAQAGEAFQVRAVARCAAFGDVENDGDVDVLVGSSNGPARLLLNQVGQSRPWIGLRLVGSAGRDMLGARVEVVTSSGAHRWRRAHTDGSYLSANDPRVIVGLGSDAGVERVRVIWPGGRVEEWPGPAVGRYHTLVEGGGHALPGP